MVLIGKKTVGGGDRCTTDYTGRMGTPTDPTLLHHVANTTSRFGVMFRTAPGSGEGFNGISPLRLASLVTRELGNGVQRVVPLRSGDLYVLGKSASSICFWSNVSTLAGIQVTPTLPKDIQTCQGVIRGINPIFWQEVRDYILNIPELRVLQVEQLRTKQGNPTRSLKITFSSAVLPDRIFLCDSHFYEVELYVPPSTQMLPLPGLWAWLQNVY